MKDLKDYFTSPKDSQNTGKKLGLNKNSKHKNFEGAKIESPPETRPLLRKKKRKRDNSTGEIATEAPPVAEPKKRKVRAMGRRSGNSGSVQRLSPASDSSRENSSTSTDMDDDIISRSMLDIPSSNLLTRYLIKMDEKPREVQKKANSKIMVVEAVVHTLPSPVVEKKVYPGRSIRANKKAAVQPDYDVITCEEVIEIPSPPPSIPSIIIEEDESSVVYAEPTITEDKPLGKIKHDGTLTSFFKVENRTNLETNGMEIAAVKQFLHSGVPYKTKQMMYKVKECQEIMVPAPFPKVSHVVQRDPMNIIWNLREVKLKIQLKESVKKNLVFPAWSSINSRLENVYIFKKEKKQNFDKKKALNALKKECKEYPVKNWYREFQKQSAKRQCDMWSEKYKPCSSDHCIGNKRNIEKLKAWLQSQRDSVKKDGQKTRDSDSGDDFIDSCNEWEDKKVLSTALLTGGVGMGKTSGSYAVSQELGYEVIELNASCNRSGKKIQQEFSEALQSHNANALNFAKKKQDSIDPPKQSLILIEDADLIFSEHDEGFISTAIALASTSKRPIIFETNNPKPKHLSKLRPFLQLDLTFSSISQAMLGSWLRTISIAEGIPLDKNQVDNLIRWAKSDIRKCLLQLQFSEGNSKILKEQSLKTKSGWDCLGAINLSGIKTCNSLAKLTNLVTVCDMLDETLPFLCGRDHLPQRHWESEVQDSTLLNESEISHSRLAENMKSHFVSSVKNHILSKQATTSIMGPSTQCAMPIMENSIIHPCEVLSRRGTCTDYGPQIRQIARLERIRLATQTKRNNRFFHYLANIGLESENQELVLDKLCNTFS